MFGVSCGSSDESVCAEPSPAMTHAQGTASAAKEPTGDADPKATVRAQFSAYTHIL